MPDIPKLRSSQTLVFIVGIGTPADIYTHVVKQLQDMIPHTAFHILEWWSQDDFGKNALREYIKFPNTTLIGHSAGGSIAIQALVERPDLVSKVVMLDSHRLQSMTPFPPITKMLDVMLAQDSAVIRSQVKRAYAPIIENSATFDKAVDYIVNWVTNDFTHAAASIQQLPAHTVLHVAFTNNHYLITDPTYKEEQQELWGRYNIDTEMLPMTHFNLLDDGHAKMIAQLAAGWLQQS